MLCRVEMPNNEQIFGRFCRWRVMFEKSIFTFLLPLIVVGMAVALFFTSEVPVIISGGLSLFVVVWYIYILFVRPHTLYQKKAGAALLTEVTIFTENGLTRSVRSEEGDEYRSESMQYSVLAKVVETTQDFYIFTSPTKAFLIDKDYFTKGEAQDLSNLLSAKLGKKYIGKKK